MSEIDIELQKQTADVSITEMMQEVDTMKKEFQTRGTLQTEQNQIGE